MGPGTFVYAEQHDRWIEGNTAESVDREPERLPVAHHGDDRDTRRVIAMGGLQSADQIVVTHKS